MNIIEVLIVNSKTVLEKYGVMNQLLTKSSKKEGTIYGLVAWGLEYSAKSKFHSCCQQMKRVPFVLDSWAYFCTAKG